MAIRKGKKWRPGRKLHVRFRDGSPEVQRRVAEVAQVWEQYANINFVFANRRDAEIRISFAQEGYWSAIGTDCLVREFFPPDQPTMNFEGFSMETAR